MAAGHVGGWPAVAGGTGVQIADCTIRNTGDIAVDVRGGTKNAVIGCDISKPAIDYARRVGVIGHSVGAGAALLANRWPGNVRQLVNAARRLTVTAPGAEIRPEDIPDELGGRSEGRVNATDWSHRLARWAEAALQEACDAAGLETVRNPGEGAFYGPKLEFVLRDVRVTTDKVHLRTYDFEKPRALVDAFAAADPAKTAKIRALEKRDLAFAKKLRATCPDEPSR